MLQRSANSSRRRSVHRRRSSSATNAWIGASAGSSVASRRAWVNARCNDNFTGALTDTLLAVEYLPFKHVGFGLGINSVRYKVEADGDTDYGVDFAGSVKLSFTGLLPYVKGYF